MTPADAGYGFRRIAGYVGGAILSSRRQPRPLESKSSVKDA